MAEIVNLRQARKGRARAEKERQAAENRTKFGRAKAEKQRDAAEAERDRRRLDQAKLTPAAIIDSPDADPPQPPARSK